MGVSTYLYDGMKVEAVFDAEHALENPNAEQITLQHDLINKMLESIESENQEQMPVIRTMAGKDTAGVFSLWKISAKNPIESKVSYVALFEADNGRLYAAYANQIWNRLVEDPTAYVLTGNQAIKPDGEGIMGSLFENYHRMEMEILQDLSTKANGRLNALSFQEKRAERIGIANIRNSRLKRIEEEKQIWLDSMRKNQSVVPDVKNIIRVRIDG